MTDGGSAGELSAGRTALAIFALGFVVALAGDACHVASGTTSYEWDGVPAIWRSALWFPFLVAGGVLATAWTVERAGWPAARTRGRADVVVGAGLVLALYALTSVMVDQPDTVSVVLIGALAVAIWAWWDPSPGTLAVATGAAVVGPLVEIAIVALGAASYGDAVDGLGGVAPWLPCLYFAAGAVAARLWTAVQRG